MKMTKKYITREEEEEQIIKDFEDGKFVRVKDFGKQKNYFRSMPEILLTKQKILTLGFLKMEEGLSYQTLAASVLHKFSAQ